MARATMYFPRDFLWGSATSAHQVEGYNRNNDWWAWEQEDGRILDRGRSGGACDWWQNAEMDIERMSQMGANAHRLSLEWSRIEPEPSVFDDEALSRYREILLAMRQRNIEPMVCLHHFANPMWLVEKGDFDSELVVDYFHRYATKAAQALGDLAPKWLTINEPMVYFVYRYLDDLFPEPKERGWRAGLRAMSNMLRCHSVAYHSIKSARPEAQVGLAKHYRVIEAWPGGNRLDRWWAGRVSRFFNDLWMESMVDGRQRWPMGRSRIKKLAGAFDFVAINYYSRSLVRFPPRRGRLYETAAPPEATMTADGFFELYPQGLFEAIRANLRYGKPIYIAENGLPDADDSQRPAFLLTHLREVWRAISFSFPVMGYYHWTLVDNFEWDRGWRQRFGLIELDPETQERKWRPSGRLFGEICQSNSISSEMAERYAPQLLETMFPGNSPAN
ncbi:MAG TPA: family 1 glycosylhydrolase [Anaerolineae bacterium]|nr:family 1 glycosylhydrolase [Anaerolineae bacterium]